METTKKPAGLSVTNDPERHQTGFVVSSCMLGKIQGEERAPIDITPGSPLERLQSNSFSEIRRI